MSAPRTDPRVRLVEYGNAERRRLRFPQFWLALFLAGGALEVALLLARRGTTEARAAAALGLVVLVLAAAIGSVVGQRRARRPEIVLARVFRFLGKEGRARLERAYRLFLKTRSDERAHGSPELAAAHFERLLDEVPAARLAEVRGAKARCTWLAASVAGLFAAALFFLFGLEIVEGGLVLTARRGAALARLPYVADAEVTVEVPAHLRGSRSSSLSLAENLGVPEGSVVTFRILPRVDRELVLTDGLRQESFVRDGSGAWVARLVATDPAHFRVAARFGEVLVFDPFERLVLTWADQAPRVVLEGAPRELALTELDRLELEYIAHDDHGLTQVDLVVRSGQKEQRTELVRLDGKQTLYRGGHALLRSHPLLSRAFLPVRVSIEARDGDAFQGPKWGASEVITLLPPPIGFDSRRRYRALAEFRGELVSALAGELAPAGDRWTDGEERRRASERALTQALGNLEEKWRALPEPPEGSLAFLRAQVEAFRKKGGAALPLEAIVLGTDVLGRELSNADARRVAEELGSALEELAVVAREAYEGTEKAASADQVQDRLVLAQGGARELEQIGVLGRDLGSVARADLGRAERAQEEKDFLRVERIALHLAARLKRGNPSFGARSSGGVESGPPSSGGGEAAEGSGSSAPSEYGELAKAAEKLAQEHARSLTDLERLLDEARRAAAADVGRDQGSREEADEIRRALSGLPEVGDEPGTASSEAALGKNQGNAMADSLEAGDPARAVERGEAASAALERAARIARERGSYLDPELLDRARERIDRAVDKARAKSQELERRLQESARQELSERAKKERSLAERTQELARQGRTGEGRLPEDSLNALERASRLMRDAARALEEGRGDQGRELAERAQAELENARPSSPVGERDEPGPGEGGSVIGEHGEVPEAEKEDRAKDFRRRVERGLGRASGALSPAVERYAEGLQ